MMPSEYKLSVGYYGNLPEIREDEIDEVETESEDED